MILLVKQRMLKAKVNEYSKFDYYNMVPIPTNVYDNPNGEI